MRKTFFSFHYTRDAWRAGQVRNSNLLNQTREDEYGFIDSAEWEKIKRQGEDAIKRWILDQLKNTSVTVVLIGTETSERDWVIYEIQKSWEKGNALLGVFIHNVKDSQQKIDSQGKNPFDKILLATGVPLSSFVRTYDWVYDGGRENIGQWIEQAFQDRNAYKGEQKLKNSEQKTSPVMPSFAPQPMQQVVVNRIPPKPHATC